MACRAAWAEAATVVAEVKRLQEGPTRLDSSMAAVHTGPRVGSGVRAPTLMGPSGCEGAEQTCRCLGWMPGRGRALFQKEVPVQRVNGVGLRGGGWSVE